MVAWKSHVNLVLGDCPLIGYKQKQFRVSRSARRVWIQAGSGSRCRRQLHPRPLGGSLPSSAPDITGCSPGHNADHTTQVTGQIRGGQYSWDYRAEGESFARTLTSSASRASRPRPFATRLYPHPSLLPYFFVY